MLYTVGYSGFNTGDFLSLLSRYSINVLIDVRSNPFSSRFSDYNKPQLECLLKQNHIHYYNYDKEFGARQPEQRFYQQYGFLDFEMFASSENYNQGYRKIETGLKKNYIVALMCSEKDPMDCHRAIMISRTFNENGHSVLHLSPDKNPITQAEIEKRLLNKYFPDRNQSSLFEDPESDEVLISKAYRMRNADIGFRIEGDVDGKSLMLIRAHNVEVYNSVYEDRVITSARFTYKGKKYENFRITDNRHKNPMRFGDAFLVVSLPSDTGGFRSYYKFIAAIYPI